MSPAEAASFRGRFGFAYLSFEGRPLAWQMRQISNRAEQRSGSHFVSDEMAKAFKDIIVYLKNFKPRLVKITGDVKPLILYTDGACEEDLITSGALLYDPDTGVSEFWGAEVPKGLRKEWKAAGVAHAVAQSELYPVLVSLRTWRKVLKSRDVLHFIDNEGVRESLVSGNTRALANLRMLESTVTVATSLGIKFWHARIPSSSNPSDYFSRLSFFSYDQWPGAKKISPRLMTPLTRYES